MCMIARDLRTSIGQSLYPKFSVCCFVVHLFPWLAPPSTLGLPNRLFLRESSAVHSIILPFPSRQKKKNLPDQIIPLAPLLVGPLCLQSPPPPPPLLLHLLPTFKLFLSLSLYLPPSAFQRKNNFNLRGDRKLRIFSSFLLSVPSSWPARHGWRTAAHARHSCDGSLPAALCGCSGGCTAAAAAAGRRSCRTGSQTKKRARQPSQRRRQRLQPGQRLQQQQQQQCSAQAARIAQPFYSGCVGWTGAHAAGVCHCEGQPCLRRFAH